MLLIKWEHCILVQIWDPMRVFGDTGYLGSNNGIRDRMQPRLEGKTLETRLDRANYRSLINNGNWTEWSANWSEIIRVISKSTKIERARSASSIWNHKYDFRPKLHSTQSNYNFIKSILKSRNFVALNFRFRSVVPSRVGLSEIAEPETLWHLI